MEFHAYKLFPPTLPSEGVKRETLLARIFMPDAPQIVLMQAPAGYGKSFALLQSRRACEERGFLTRWLTLDEADNDTRRFLIHFAALLASGQDGSTEDSNGHGPHVERGYRSDWAIDRLLKLPQPVAIFLDDFQTLEGEAVLAFAREFLERLPHGTRIFIGSRSTPELGLARLLVSERALVLRSEDMRFSAAEAVNFLSADNGVAVSNEEFGRIYELTNGWQAALQLYRLSLINPSVRGSLADFSSSRPRELADYLAENVLSLQSTEIQDFLLRTSLLTRLSPPLCDAITGRSDSKRILAWLERSGLFVRGLDKDEREFEYHALFASFLRDQQYDRSESVALAVHHEAAKWRLQQGDFEEALHHAISCNDFALAAKALDIWSSRLVAGALLMTAERWFDRLPFDEIARRPSLMIKIAWALIFLQRREKLSPILALLERLRRPYAIDKTTDPTIVLSMAAIANDDAKAAFQLAGPVSISERRVARFAAFELGAAANLAAYRNMICGDFEGARASLAVARVQGERGEAPFSQGYTVGLAGVNLLAQGQLQDSLRRFRSGMAEQVMRVDRSHASAALASCYIWALYESDALDEAEAVFGQYRDIIVESTLLDFQAVAHLSMARIHDIRGRAREALAVLEEAEAIGHTNGWPRLVRTVSWERVRRSLLSGDLDDAKANAEVALQFGKTAAEEWIQFSEDLEGESLGRIRLAIYSRDVDRSKELLKIEFAHQQKRVFRQMKLHLLEAQLQNRLGARNRAQRCLRKAVRLGTPGGYIRCFVDEGAPIRDMLREEYESLVDSAGRPVPDSADPAFVERLLRAFGADPVTTSSPKTQHQPERLTEQEVKIIAFLANGVSNKEMAARLFLSENTVKFHLKHIYSKLRVSSRTQAVLSARDLGLVT
jgi:LuxR family maltose regulon positive regulatory protein